MPTDPNIENRRYWDQQAASFDDYPDHGLREPNFIITAIRNI
jgi:hypothetical protein